MGEWVGWLADARTDGRMDRLIYVRTDRYIYMYSLFTFRPSGAVVETLSELIALALLVAKPNYPIQVFKSILFWVFLQNFQPLSNLAKLLNFVKIIRRAQTFPVKISDSICHI